MTGSPRPEAGNVWAVIVTYHPDDGLVARVRRTADQVAGVVIVDNASAGAARDTVVATADEIGAELISNERNVGLARALNQGCARALAAGARWILTLDQDSRPLPELVTRLAAVHDDVPDRERLGMIGSGVAETAGYAYCRDRDWSEQPVVITSGSLLSADAYRACGPFEEGLFIDYVDAEYCLRLRRHGFKVVISCRETMEHAIGNPSLHRLLVRSVTPTNHSPERRYYITRNRVTVWRRYWRAEWGFVRWDVVESAKELVKLVLFEDERARKFVSVAEGLRDAIGGRSGVRRR